MQPQLPRRTLVLDEPGLARELSLPFDGDDFSSPLLSSYRLVNGVLHNPANDRRTTAGVFHIAEGGLPIPDDKLAVPTATFARLLALAFEPPQTDMVLPYTANEATPAACFVSLLLRPLVSPEVPGSVREKRMETRFIVPGGTVANLDFVEGIFGNGGDPYLPENDASLAPETWTGHTGCVILAPHLTRVTKKEVGLPHVSEATERQQRDGMCWETEDELYNGGKAFKVCARDARGVIVTVIADTYFGYCKKEVKTQISYSANLFGNAEEEHSGGALVFASYNLGQEYDEKSSGDGYTLAEVLERDPERFAPQPAGHADDREQPHIVLVPGGAHYSMRDMTVSWPRPDGGTGSVPLRADKAYLSPNGYRVTVAQQPHDPSTWTLIGTVPNATSCHKPATVSGGGKSEISKAITDAFIVGSAFVAELRDRHGRGHRDPRPRLLPALPRPRAQRHRPAPDPVAATARWDRSSSCSPRRARSTPPTTTPGSRASRPTSRSSSTSSSAPTARSGATTGAATSASPRSTAGRATRCTSTAPRSPSTCCASATTSTARGACSACGTTSRPR